MTRKRPARRDLAKKARSLRLRFSTWWAAQVITLFSILVFACTPQLFPPGTLKDVDPNFDFTRWRMFPTSMVNHKVQFGGRIVQSDTQGEMLTIVAARLPIVEHPAYGPKETRKSGGEFVILYEGKIDPLFLHEGNRVIVIGFTRPPTRVDIDDTPHSFPTIRAECLHIWQTGNKDIADFHSSGAGYIVLREETYCRKIPWSPMPVF
jgi:starvation-inducible outer membrane lipoprotein